MKKMIIILLCLLFIAAGLPLFARGQSSDHGRFWKDNAHRWHGSAIHPAFHGWRGWGKAPSHAPDGIPAEDPPDKPQEDPGDKPPQEPGDKDGEEPMGGVLIPNLILNPIDGSFPG